MASEHLWTSKTRASGSPLIVGMLHIPALPTSPQFGGDMISVLDQVLQDAEVWTEAGVEHLMLENFGDVPFLPGSVSAVTIAHMASIAQSVKDRFSVSVGVNVLRNDAVAALSIAHAVGGDAIRANILAGSRLTDQGIIQGQAAEVMRLRKQLNADHIAVLAVVDVKHSVPLAIQSLTDQTRDLIDRSHADAVIVSGTATGEGVNQDALAEVSEAANETPVLIGSGVSVDTVNDIKPFADGYIIGTSVKRNGDVRAEVDSERVKNLVDLLRS